METFFNIEPPTVEIFKKGDLVISHALKTSKGMPYIIKVYEDNKGVITYFYKGETGYISSFFVKRSTKWDRFCGYFYDKFFK